MLVCKRYELIECQVPVTGANSQNLFVNQPQLQTVLGRQDVVIVAITAHNITTLAVNPLSSIQIVGVADIPNAVLTLVVTGTESIKKVPLSEISRIIPDAANYVPATWQPFLLDEISTVDWSKSYVTTLAAVGAPISYIFGVYYYYVDQATGKRW